MGRRDRRGLAQNLGDVHGRSTVSKKVCCTGVNLSGLVLDLRDESAFLLFLSSFEKHDGVYGVRDGGHGVLSLLRDGGGLHRGGRQRSAGAFDRGVAPQDPAPGRVSPDCAPTDFLLTSSPAAFELVRPPWISCRHQPSARVGERERTGVVVRLWVKY